MDGYILENLNETTDKMKVQRIIISNTEEKDFIEKDYNEAEIKELRQRLVKLFKRFAKIDIDILFIYKGEK